jgi:hypothetical protein
MKKGLFSILAGALLVVGCQNYDDQFSNIESQITALASQVAGLSQVQSDLTSLANQVTSLQSSVADTVDAALADGLADIDTAVASLEAATATAASSADVAAIATAVAANATDLTELLAQSSVYTGDVVVNSESTLNAFHSMGASLNIVNGSVNITTSAAMDATKVQGLVDNILTVIGDFTFTSGASTIAEVTFNNLTGVQTMTLKQGGGYKAQGLISAEKIVLNDAWKSTVTIIDFRAMKSVGSLMTTATAHTVDFNKATEIHLTVLERYGANLTLKGAKNGVIALGALKDVDANGLVSALALTIDGPAAMTLANFDGKLGSITASNIGALTVNSYNGTINVLGDVTSFSTDGVHSLGTSTMSDTTTLVMAGKLDPNAIGTTAAPLEGPSLSLTANTDLENVTISGIVKVVNLSNQGSLISAIISADVSGAITLDTNSDLTTVTLTGSKATGVTVNACDDLGTLTVDTTMRGTALLATTINGTVAVTSNTDLTALTVSSNKVRTLTVTGNTDLATIDMTGMAATGSTAKAAVNVYSNKLVATVAQDTAEATGVTATAGTATDNGLFTTTSGMATLKTYLTAVVADTGSTAAVYFDTIDSTTNSTGVETLGSQTYAAAPTSNRVLVLSAGSGDGVAAKGEIATTVATVIDLSDLGVLGLERGAGVDLFSDGTTASTKGSLTISANKTFTMAAIKNAANVARFAAYGITLDAKRGGNSTGNVSLVMYKSGGVTTTIDGERYTAISILDSSNNNSSDATSATNYGVGLDDLFTFSVGGNSVTVSPGGTYGGVTGTATTMTGITASIFNAYEAKYGPTGTASASKVASLTQSVRGGTLAIKMYDEGTGGYDKAVSLSLAAGTVTATNAGNIGWVIGTTVATSDNNTVDADIVMLMTSVDAGTTLDKTASVSWVTNSATQSGLGADSNAGDIINVELLTSTKYTNTPDTTAPGLEALETGRTDVVNAENGLAAVAETTPAAQYSRLGWL